MGVKSTFTVRKIVAINIIAHKLYSATNEELEQLLECFKESEYRNYLVYTDIDGDEGEDRVIEDIEDFEKPY